MNKQDAQTLATRLTNLYATEENKVKFTLPNFSDEEKMKDCFYVGIWIGASIVATTDERQFDALLRFARILVQTENDLLQVGNDPGLYDRDKSPVSSEEQEEEISEPARVWIQQVLDSNNLT